LTSWGNIAKDIIIELGFGHQSTPLDKVDGKIYIFYGQLERIHGIGLDQTNAEKGGGHPLFFVIMDISKKNPPFHLT
jgi:hypothetical protein